MFKYLQTPACPTSVLKSKVLIVDLPPFAAGIASAVIGRFKRSEMLKHCCEELSAFSHSSINELRY